jgi:hypothetical protein
MSYSYTNTETTAFTLTHAKHIAAKVSTDLKRMQRFYGAPSDAKINRYEDEVIQLLKYGYLETVTYGFKKNDCWIEPSLVYTASDLDGAGNDDPGRIRPNKDITGASFYSFLTYSSAWDYLSADEQSKFKMEELPFIRGSADEPGINGYLDNDRIYSSGGKTLSRASVRGH